MKNYGRIKFSLFPILLVLAFVGIILVINTKSSQTAETIDISTAKNFACDSNILPLSVALEKGYFTEENIKVNLVDSANDTENAQKSSPYSEADVIIIGRATFYRLEDKYPGLFKVFNFNLQDENKWNDAVIVKKDSGITSLSQLKGKTIGFESGDDPVLRSKPEAIKVMLEKNGLNPTQFSIVSASLSDLENNAVAVLYIREPHLTLSLHSGKNKILEEGPIFAKYVFSPWPMSVSAISSKFIKQKPETAKKIVRVWDRSISFIRENPTEANKLQQGCMKKNFGLDGAKLGQINHWKSNEIDKNLVQRQLNWYQSIGITTKALNVNDILY